MSLRSIALLTALLLTAGCNSQPQSSTQNDWIETQMFFGLTQPNGQQLSNSDWQNFVDHSITPRFPDGLTILRTEGQIARNDGTIHKEPSAVLILLHPPGDDLKLNEIAREYQQRFHQESVLRADLPANTSFIRSAPQTQP